MPNKSTLLHRGRIYRSTDPSPATEALLVQDGIVVVSGLLSEIEQLTGPNTERVDLGGRTVLPGLIDAHIHLEMYAQYLQMVDCELPSKAECMEKLAEKAERTASDHWIRGHGWNQNVWDGFGTAQELDQVLPNHPAYLTAKSLHAAWVNSQALQLAGIHDTTPDPEDGHIDRDDNGAATGILFEGAMRLVADTIPSSTSDQLADDLILAQNKLSRYGLTGVHDFDGPNCLRAVQILRERDQLNMRVLKNIPVTQLAAAQELGLRSGFGDAWIRIGNIKVFADGALGPQTAAMLKPYEGDLDNRGMLLMDGEALTEVFEQAARAGFGMTVHAIGDRANHEVLNAYSLLRDYESEHQLPLRRHRIEHLQVLHKDDLNRPSELGLVASMQPIHATSDMDMADRYWGDRVAGAYAWRTQLDRGTTLAFGSDAPVESPDPIAGIHASVTRQRADGSPGADGWLPDQRISLQQALAAYTTGSAFAAGTESWQGRLMPGYAADLVVLDLDPFQVQMDQLLELDVKGTMVAGSWSYRDF